MTEKLAIAKRIKELRIRSPFTQADVASRLGITLRAYQHYEKKGVSDTKRMDQLAKIHSSWARHDPEWGFVSAGWIWDGKDRRLTPNLQGLNGVSLLSIEEKLGYVVDWIETQRTVGDVDAGRMTGREPAESPAGNFRDALLWGEPHDDSPEAFLARLHAVRDYFSGLIQDYDAAVGFTKAAEAAVTSASSALDAAIASEEHYHENLTDGPDDDDDPGVPPEPK